MEARTKSIINDMLFDPPVITDYIQNNSRNVLIFQEVLTFAFTSFVNFLTFMY